MEDRSEGNKGRKGRGEFVVAGGDVAVALKGTEEVFDTVSLAIVAAMEGTGFDPLVADGQAREDILFDPQEPERIRVVALVRQHRGAAESADVPDQRRGHGDIGHIACAEQPSQWPSAPVDQGMNLGRESAAAWSHGLGMLPAAGIGGALADSHISRVNAVEPPRGALVQALEEALPKALITPTRKVSIDRSPMAACTWQIPPRATRPEHV